MPTLAEGTTIVVGAHNDLMDMATAASATARADLETLRDGAAALPLTVVDVDIGGDTVIEWGIFTAPVEPDYGDVVAPEVPDPPAEVTEIDAMGWDLDAGPGVGAIDAASLSAVPALGTVPEIDAAVPSMDVTLLDADFEYTDDPYTEVMTPTVQAQILRVLGGDLGLPQSYFDAIYAQVAGDLARLQTTELRAIRNRGAASMMDLPDEAVLVGTREVTDKGMRSLQMDRLQKAVQQATMAREDFWQGIGQALAAETMSSAIAHQAAQRALAAAEQSVGLRVSVHNANVARYNAMLAGAQADGTIQQAQVERALRSHASGLAAVAAEIQQGQVRVEEFKATLAAYQADRSDHIGVVAEKVRWHMSQIDRDRTYQTLLQERTKTEVALFTAQLGQVESVARATAAVLGARTQAGALVLESDVKRNAANLDVSRITLGAQEASARIDVAQAQWAAGQSASLQAKIADNSFGYAQALAAAAHVGLSWGLSSSESYTP